MVLRGPLADTADEVSEMVGDFIREQLEQTELLKQGKVRTNSYSGEMASLSEKIVLLVKDSIGSE